MSYSAEQKRAMHEQLMRPGAMGLIGYLYREQVRRVRRLREQNRYKT